MPAPTNTSFATAIDLGSTLPINVTQQIDDAGTYYTVFYKMTVTAPVVFGCWIYGSVDFDYIPRVDIFKSDHISLVDQYSSQDDAVLVLNFEVADTYFFKIAAVGPKTKTPAIVTINIIASPTTAVVSGDILINDDTVTHPLSINSQADGTLSKYITPFPSGEYGTTLTGYIGFLDDSDDKLKIYDNNFNLLNTVDAWPGLNAAQQTIAFFGSNHDDNFYWGVIDNGAGVAAIKKIKASSGAVLATYSPLFGTVINAGLAADANGNDTILYYTDSDVAGNKPVKRWDLVGNAPLADLVAGVVNYRTLEIKVLNDATILVCYYKTSLDDVIVKHYSTAGAVLNTYSFGDANDATSIPRMCAGPDNATSFWMYFKNGGGGTPGTRVRFLRTRISDGAALVDSGDITAFNSGHLSSAEADPATPPDRFGPSPSCPIMLLLGSVGPIVGSGGLYQIRPGKREDTYYGSVNKIPDPTIRTAIIGE